MPVASKVAVVGTGYVGAAVAYTLMLSGLVRELVLVDIDRARAEGEAMDMAHGESFVRPVKVYAGDYGDCRGAKIVVFAAGAAQSPGQTRLELVARNVGVLQQALPPLTEACPDAILLMVTNPVDVLTYAASRITGWPVERVIGSGTVLDSSRFRYALSRHCRVDPRNVHAYIIGEHGDSEVPVWSRATIAGLSVEEYCRQRGLPPPDRQAVFEEVRGAAYEIIARKGATNLAISLAVRRICEAILRDEHSVLTVSGLVDGPYGLRGVALSLPGVVGARGREAVLVPTLSPEEEAALRRSAEILASVQAEVGG
ncbi:MAG: L-lactate dehydrogenase [Firmicutes bacterium]|nr:L-lactate dehydrogenase [Bacillota bacterium]